MVWLSSSSKDPGTILTSSDVYVEYIYCPCHHISLLPMLRFPPTNSIYLSWDIMKILCPLLHSALLEGCKDPRESALKVYWNGPGAVRVSCYMGSLENWECGVWNIQGWKVSIKNLDRLIKEKLFPLAVGLRTREYVLKEIGKNFRGNTRECLFTAECLFTQNLLEGWGSRVSYYFRKKIKWIFDRDKKCRQYGKKWSKMASFV